MSTLTIDQSLCVQCGTCVAAYPELFEMAEDGTVRVKPDADFSKISPEDLGEIKNICPNGAIVDAKQDDVVKVG